MMSTKEVSQLTKPGESDERTHAPVATGHTPLATPLSALACTPEVHAPTKPERPELEPRPL